MALLSEPGGKKDYSHSYDVELEQALLGLVLVEQKLLAVAAEHLQADSFHEGIHAAVFELMLEQDQAGKAITPITLQSWLRHDPRFEQVGGANSYLSEMALAAPAITSIADGERIIAGMAENLLSMALRRRGLGVISDAQASILDGKPVVAALADVVLVADEIAALEVEGDEDARSAHQVTHALLRDLERQAVSELAFACPTRIHSLDKILGGLVPGNFIVIGGRPGMGKTIVGCELAIAAGMEGWEPDYWSLEMPGRELGARMVSSLDYDLAVRARRKPVLYSKLVQLSADQPELAHAAQANVALRNLPISIFDFEDVTMARISAVCRARAAKAARRGKRKIFIIDHLGLIEPDERYRGRKVDELTLITKRAKQLAKRTASPVVMLAQLNRGVEERDDKRPRIADFRDSGSIEQDADVLIGLYRHDYYAAQRAREASRKGNAAKTDAETEAERLKNTLELEVLKNRNGETGTAQCHINVKSGALRSEEPVAERAPVLAFGGRYDDPINQLDIPPSQDVPIGAYADEANRGA